MPNRFIAVGCLVVIALFVVVIGGAALFAASLPPVSQQLPPESAPLLVNLTTPLDSSDVPLDSPTSIQARGLGTVPIVSLELWVDGNPAETANAPRADLKQLDAIWSWLPDSPGAHTLVARATDAAHHVVNSNVVRINAAQASANLITTNYQVKTGDTLASIAQKSGATVGQIAEANPGLGPSSPIAAGQTISVPQTVKTKKANPTPTPSPTPSPAATASPSAAVTPQASSQPSGGQSLNPFANLNFWAQKNLVAVGSLAPAPLLTAGSNGCNAVLSIVNQADNASGFFIYRTTPDNPQFTRIATIEAAARNQPQSYTDNNIAGPLEYYVAAFNAAGESPSKIVSMTIVDRSCALLSQVSSPLHFENGQLIPVQPVDKVYCYLAENSGPFSRVPSAANTFIYPANGIFDVSAYLKTLATAQVTTQMTLDLDCWGWRGGTLSYLGDAKQTFSPQTSAPVQVANDKFKFIGALNPLINPKLFDPVTQQLVFPPQSLQGTSDPTLCTQHMDPLTVLFGGAQLCASSIQQHYVVLVWDWVSPSVFSDPANPNVKYQVVQDIQGYRVYENDTYFQHSLVGSSTAGPKNKVTMFPLPTVSKFQAAVAFLGVDSNRCFVVRAYKGSLESSDSNTFCQGALPGTKTVVLHPSIGATTQNQRAFETCPFSTKFWGTDYPSGVGAGYIFETENDPTGAPCHHRDTILRGLAKFDLSQIGPVWTATLHYHLLGTMYGDNWDGDDPSRLIVPLGSNPGISCAVELMIATQDGSNVPANNVVTGDDYAPIHGPAGVVDVTTVVRRWQTYAGYVSGVNDGFALRGAREFDASQQVEDWSQCTSVYDLTLEVTYFP